MHHWALAALAAAWHPACNASVQPPAVLEDRPATAQSTGGHALTVEVSGLVAGAQVTLRALGQEFGLGNAAASLFEAVAAGTPLPLSLTAPAGQTCAHNDLPATMPDAELRITVTCAPLSYPLTLEANGLLPGATLWVESLGASARVSGDAGAVAALGERPFASLVGVLITTQPAGAACAFADGSTFHQEVMPARALALAVTCTADPAVVAGTVSGLRPGTQLVLAQGADSITVTGDPNRADVAFVFPGRLSAGEAFNVAVVTQPDVQRCQVVGGTGIVVPGQTPSVQVTCVPFMTLASGQSAAVAIGQPDLTGGASRGAGMAGGFDYPYGSASLAEDGSLYLTDPGGSRILGFDRVPVASGTPADFVLGDGSYSYPLLVAVGGGKTVVYDNGLATLMMYNGEIRASTPPTAVLNDGAGATPAGVAYSLGMALSGGHLAVSDQRLHRVLVWPSLPTAGPAPASIVLGQPDLTSTSPQPVTASGLSSPLGVWFDAHHTAVVDGDHKRVLIWNRGIQDLESFAPADVVLGAPDFTTPGGGQISQRRFAPSFVASNGTQLFVSSSDENRVLVWNQIPTANDAPADVVLGQADFTASGADAGGSISGVGLNYPWSLLATDTQLVVADVNNSRYLVFDSH